MGNELLQLTSLKVQDLDELVQNSGELFNLHEEPLNLKIVELVLNVRSGFPGGVNPPR
jgi:hypothetical protein